MNKVYVVGFYPFIGADLALGLSQACISTLEVSLALEALRWLICDQLLEAWPYIYQATRVCLAYT